MNSEEIEEHIREFINKTPHMSLATSRDNKPWVCEVHFANDTELNLFFVSKLNTRHCQEIASNSFVAGNIIKQHPLTESPRGIYFEGQAAMLDSPTDVEVDNYCTALSRDSVELKKLLKEPDSRRMYKIIVKNWAIFGKFGTAANEKYELSWNGGKR